MPGPSPRPAGYEALEARSRMLGGYVCASCVPADCCAGAYRKLYFLCISNLKLLLVLFTETFYGVALENLSCNYTSDFMIVLSCMQPPPLFFFNTFVL